MAQQSPTIGNARLGKGFVPDQPLPPNVVDQFVNMSQMSHGTGPLEPSFCLLENKISQNVGPYTKHVYNQGEIGSCTCNAVATLYDYELQHLLIDAKNYRPSRLFFYYVARLADNKKISEGASGQYYRDLAKSPPTDILESDTGTQVREVVKVLACLGAPTEPLTVGEYAPNDGSWPYEDTAVTPIPGSPDGVMDKASFAARPPDPECFVQAQKHFALTYLRAEVNVECWKRCIRSGHAVAFGFRAYPSFDAAKVSPYIAPTPLATDIIPPNDPIAGHACVAVGWKDENGKGFFRVQNSWGETWGDGGLFWMPFEWLNMYSPLEPGTKLIDNPWTIKGSS